MFGDAKVKEIVRPGDIDLDQVRLRLNQRPERMFMCAGCIVESHKAGSMRAMQGSTCNAVKSRERERESRLVAEENGRIGTSFSVEFPRCLVECCLS